jgi:hypothetical protein
MRHRVLADLDHGTGGWILRSFFDHKGGTHRKLALVKSLQLKDVVCIARLQTKNSARYTVADKLFNHY